MKRIILMIGIPGSGKTTLAKKLIEKGYKCLAADKIREEIYGKEIEQGDPKEVFEIFFNRLEELMAEGSDIIIDNTNLKAIHRQPILERAKQFEYSDVQLWMLDVPLDVCLARNKNRDRNVPDDIVTNYFNDLHRSRPKRSEGRLIIIKPGNDENDYRFFAAN